MREKYEIANPLGSDVKNTQASCGGDCDLARLRQPAPAAPTQNKRDTFSTPILLTNTHIAPYRAELLLQLFLNFFRTHSFIVLLHTNPSPSFTTCDSASRLAEIMFKKPFASLKSFSPLRSSDKRRLRDEILASFPELKEMESSIPDTPVNATITPEGLQSAKFTSYIEEPGTMYTDAEGTPLWFKISNSKKDSLIVPSCMFLNG